MLAHDLFIVLPEEVLALSGIVLMLVAAWAGERAGKVATWLAVLALVAAAFLLPGIGDAGDTAFSGMFAGDSFAAFAKVVIYAAAGASLLAAAGWFGRAGDLKVELPVLVLFAAVGMGIMVSATDLLTLYVGLELQNLALYVLAAFRRDDTRSAEAGLKYFVLSALASGLVLYGISLLYGFTGSTLFGDVAAGLADGLSTGELFGLVFLLAGLAFKISAVPFHMWAPDVYQGAPTPITAFFATAPKLAAMAMIARVLVEATGPATESWRQMIIFMALASTVLGGVAAIAQKNIKRLLAYSSINNVGFALVGLAAGTPDGVAAVLFYMTVYIVMTFGAFLIVLRMRDQDGQPIETIASLAGLARTRPWMAFGMMIFMFSLAGIPPLFGFWPKFVVFNAAVAADLTWLAAVAIATSVISAFYYIMIVKTMFFDDPAPAYAPTRDPVTAVLAVAAALFVSPLGYLAIGPLDYATTIAADTLFTTGG
jgi:NADH-quinone oxidoreductase subunit N